jgi:hypothetical protein
VTTEVQQKNSQNYPLHNWKEGAIAAVNRVTSLQHVDLRLNQRSNGQSIRPSKENSHMSAQKVNQP